VFSLEEAGVNPNRRLKKATITFSQMNLLNLEAKQAKKNEDVPAGKQIKNRLMNAIDAISSQDHTSSRVTTLCNSKSTI